MLHMTRDRALEPCNVSFLHLRMGPIYYQDLEGLYSLEEKALFEIEIPVLTVLAFVGLGK